MARDEATDFDEDYEDNNEEYYDEIQKHVASTQNANTLVLLLSWLGCLVCAGFGVYSFLDNGDWTLAVVLPGVSIVGASLAYLLWAFVQNSTNTTELLIIIASRDDVSD
jgi:hypothetical protein